MPRPRKVRIVEFVPSKIHFVPVGRRKCDLEEVLLKVEEIEAIRLKDLENLNQDECAEKMKVSRQTFQRILSEARRKIATSLIEAKALRVEGGNFTRNLCQIYCNKCEHNWEETYENYKQKNKEEYKCPICDSAEVLCCKQRKGFCGKGCDCN